MTDLKTETETANQGDKPTEQLNQKSPDQANISPSISQAPLEDKNSPI